MALPTSREQTANNSMPISSAVLNAVQDAIIGAKRKEWYTPLWITPRFAGSWTVDVTGYIVSSAGVGGHMFLPGIDIGDRITGFNFRALGNGAINLTVGLSLITNATGGAAIGGTSIGSSIITPTAVYQQYALGTTIPFVPTTLALGEALMLTFQAAAANVRIGYCEFRRDRL